MNVTTRDARRLLAFLICAELCLVVVYLADAALAAPVDVIHRLFDLDGELTVPNWFSATQLALIGLLCLLAARDPGHLRQLSPWFLATVGVGFLFLSLDEAAKVHEAITPTFRRFDWLPSFRGGHGIWVPIYLAIGLAFVVAVRRQLLSAWRHYRREALILVIGGIIYLLAAVGLEVVSYEFLRAETVASLYRLEVAAEELLEMASVSIMLYGTILLARHTGTLFGESPRRPGRRE